jgi:hypothetical protein
MDKLKFELKELLKRYSSVKDELTDFDSLYYDSILFDIEGYYENFDFLDIKDLIKLKKKVLNFEKLVYCLKKVDKLSFEYC